MNSDKSEAKLPSESISVATEQLIPSRSYYSEKALAALRELSISRKKLGVRLECALEKFVFVPRKGLPKSIALSVEAIDDVVLRYPKILEERGYDAKIGGQRIRDFEYIRLNFPDSWQKQTKLAEDPFYACVEIIEWASPKC